MKEITSKENKLIKYVLKLKDKKFIKKEKKYIVEGEHFLKMADINDVFLLFTTEDNSSYSKFNSYLISQELMKKLSQYKSITKVLMVINIKEKELESKNVDTFIYLNNIQDPGNLGTILRNSLAFNFKNIICDNFYELFNFKTIQASQGAIFKLNLYEGNFESLSNLKKGGFSLLGTILDKDSVDIKKTSLEKKSIIIFGNEGKGIDKEIESICDKKIIIKMNSELDSLNVGVASGIVLYHFSTNKLL